MSSAPVPPAPVPPAPVPPGPVPLAPASLAHADRVVARPRRVYREVAVTPQPAPAGGGGGERWYVLLDLHPVKTPAGAPLLLPTRALAELCAGEWRGQGAEVDWATMPATRLAFTALDRGDAARQGLADEVARYAAGDTLAAWADAPPRLRARQEAEWGPWLRWAAEAMGVRLEPGEGVMPRAQPAESLARVRLAAVSQDAFALTGLAFAAALFGSAVLAFAVQEGRLTGEAAHDLARLEEAHQESEWGVDAEAAARTAARLEEARFIARWFAAAAAPPDTGS